MIWNTNKECMSREQMRELQGKRLQKLVTYVYHNVPFTVHECRRWICRLMIFVRLMIL